MICHTIHARDGYPLNVHAFETENPKAVIQIIHGMEEHQKRYERLALYLNHHGFNVVTSDLRGHGETAKELGFFKEDKGYIELIQDQLSIRKFIKEKYPDCPVYLFAHSMGSIIARVYMQHHSGDFQKIVLSGYPNYHNAAFIGILISSVLKRIRGPKYKSRFLELISVGLFNRYISNPQSPVDWICSDPDVIKSYIRDPYCGFGFTCSAYNDLYHLLMLMHNASNYKMSHPDLPILMLRGLEDPCVGFDKGAADSFSVLSHAGFKNITRIDYAQMRHEIINETDFHKTYGDIVRFYES